MENGVVCTKEQTDGRTHEDKQRQTQTRHGAMMMSTYNLVAHSHMLLVLLSVPAPAIGSALNIDGSRNVLSNSFTLLLLTQFLGLNPPDNHDRNSDIGNCRQGNNRSNNGGVRRLG